MFKQNFDMSQNIMCDELNVLLYFEFNKSVYWKLI